ncbi:SAVED domain-containing protein [Dankookia rubra]|nr:SAVED domain-containing protein [Dankookia rubra]
MTASRRMAKPPTNGSRRGRSNKLRERTVFEIWVRAAGRCQYPGCNRILLGDLLAGNRSGRFGFVAHIVADAPNGPRGDPVRSHELADDIRNVMLLCGTHHKVVDVDELLAHPEEVLLAMKAAHEERIQIQTAISEERASHVLIYGANIGRHEAPLSFDRIARDMMPERYPAGGRPIAIELLGSPFTDYEADYWSIQRRVLHEWFGTQVRDRLARREINHLSVFALAPQPLLIELGTLLCDIALMEVRQLHREPSGWRWARDGQPISYSVRRPAERTGLPALVLALSATVTEERITVALGPRAAVWAIAAEQPGNDVMRRPEDLQEFRRLVRMLFDEIKAAHGEDAVISIFPVLPVSAAVEVGRVWMPKADLPLQVYDQNRAHGGFEPALLIGTRRERGHPAA